MTSVPIESREAFQSYKVKTEAGSEVIVNVAERAAARRQEAIDVPDQYRDRASEAKGRLPFMQSGKPRVYMYRGYTESLVPEDRIGWFLKQGFTTAPTQATPKTDVVCGIFLSELGRPCDKHLQSHVWRLHHIREAHSELAPWVLTDEDHKRIRGDMGLSNSSTSVDYDQVQRVAELEAKLDSVLALLEKGNEKEAIDELDSVK